MSNPISEVSNLINSVGKSADNLTTTKEEQEQFRSNRHIADMTSDNTLAKSVRPISLYISWLLIISMAVATILKVEIDAWIMGEFLAMHGTILSFYFYSRKGEKIAAKNASANIILEKMRLKASIKAEKKANRNK